MLRDEARQTLVMYADTMDTYLSHPDDAARKKQLRGNHSPGDSCLEKTG